MDECTERGFSSTESNERLQAIILIVPNYERLQWTHTSSNY